MAEKPKPKDPPCEVEIIAVWYKSRSLYVNCYSNDALVDMSDFANIKKIEAEGINGTHRLELHNLIEMSDVLTYIREEYGAKQ